MSGLDSRLQKNFQEFDEFDEKIIDDHIKKEILNKQGDDIIDVLLDLEKSQSESAHGIQLSKHKYTILKLFSSYVPNHFYYAGSFQHADVHICDRRKLY
ncbi:hypothetical protein M5689_013425 [Euphorbia peplus]|nr:hypothetical protein M5689_013425 [Euphorbia peplus]